jgi:branched-chain amino acid transport system substrate-binding protein
MKKTILWVVIVLVVVGVIVLVSNKGQKSSNSNRSVKVGVLVPLSTDFAWWGEAILDSLKVAQANGYGKEFEFVSQDTKCNTKDAISGTQFLKAQHPDMHLFIVGCDNDLKAMIPMLDKEKDLAFMVGLSGASLYEPKFPIINLAYRLEDEATAAAKFAAEKLGVKNIGILVANTEFGGTLDINVSKYFNGVGGKAVSEQIKYNEPNPETSVLKIIQSKPDAVYIQNDIPAMAAILKRLIQLDYEGKRIVYYGGRDQSLIDGAGVAAEGVYVPWVISDQTSSVKQKFLETFKQLYNKDPFVTAYFVYDGLIILDQADKSCSGDVRCIENYFYNKDGFENTLGKVTYQPDGNVERSFYFQQVKDGKFVEIK